ncbi:MAG: DUF3179 domain-containing protein [bacterium]|nr:DUF3179 domain-containing protein [bacterium]
MRTTVLFTLVAGTLLAQLPPGEWKTDLSKKSVPLAEFHVSLAKDAIPAIDRPEFVSVEDASAWLTPGEPVMIFVRGDDARAYPIQILLFHELVNDQFGDLPVLVSFCPLCNSGLIFDRRVDGVTYDFGVAGLLRRSDMVMYDRQTDSLWQQVTGEAIVGLMTGKSLRVISGQVVKFGDFASTHPQGRVLRRPAGSTAPYGVSHYVNYEHGRRNQMPVRLKSPLPVAPLERVVAVTINGRSRAYPFEYLRSRRVQEDRFQKTRYVIFFEPEMLRAMEAKQLAASRAVGTAGVFSPMLDGRRLRFRKKKGRIIDKESGSEWNVLGHAIDGPLKGAQLDPIQHGVFFAFALAVFHPNAEFVGVPRVDDEFFSGGAGSAVPPPR